MLEILSPNFHSSILESFCLNFFSAGGTAEKKAWEGEIFLQQGFFEILESQEKVCQNCQGCTAKKSLGGEKSLPPMIGLAEKSSGGSFSRGISNRDAVIETVE